MLRLLGCLGFKAECNLDDLGKSFPLYVYVGYGEVALMAKGDTRRV